MPPDAEETSDDSDVEERRGSKRPRDELEKDPLLHACILESPSKIDQLPQEMQWYDLMFMMCPYLWPVHFRDKKCKIVDVHEAYEGAGAELRLFRESLRRHFPSKPDLPREEFYTEVELAMQRIAGNYLLWAEEMEVNGNYRNFRLLTREILLDVDILLNDEFTKEQKR